MHLSSSSRPEAATVGRWILGGWFGLLLLQLWLAQGVSGPIVLQDESGYLGNARWLAGIEPVFQMGDHSVYGWGYSVLITPLTILIDDPALLYRAIQVINSILLASLLPLLWVLLRRIGQIAPAPAALAAVAGSVFPATLVHSAVAWAESLLPVLMVLLVLTTWLALTERPAWQRLLIVPVAVAAYATHGRFLPVLGLVIVGLVAAGATRIMPRFVAGTGVVLALVGLVGVRLVNAALLEARWLDRDGGAGSEGRLLARAANPSNWPGIIGGSIGQGWYLSVASLGLVAVGVLALVVWLRQRPVRDASTLTAAFTLVSILALFVTSVVSFVGTAQRVDHLIYGRYNEAFAPLLVAVGAAALLVASPAVRRQLAIAAGGLTLVLGAVLWVGRGTSSFDGAVVWNNILGLRLVTDVVGQSWMVPAATVLACVAIVALGFAGRWPHPAMVAASIVLVVSGVVAAGPLADFSSVLYRGWELPEQLERVVDAVGVDEVGLDRETAGLMATQGYPFWLPDVAFAYTDTWTGSPPGLVVAHHDHPGFDVEGAAIVLLDARNAQAVWAMPDTPAFEQLVDLGAVLPASFPSELDDAARQAEVEVSSTEVVMTAGTEADIDLEVTHTGEDQAWPSDVEWPLPGVVRVGVVWLDETGEEVQSNHRVPLAGPMWPGDTQALSLSLRAVTEEGQPLAAGHYQVELRLLQAGFIWFPEAAASIEVKVVANPEGR